MHQWLTKTIYKYTKKIILFCLFLLIVFAFFNFFTGKKGSYTNHDETIKTLFELPFHSKRSYNLKPPDLEDKPYSPDFYVGTEGATGSKDFQSKGERECKRSIEEITRKPFIKYRPDFLKNKVTGKNLELDCYNDEIGLAIEYNGIQHYEYTPVFHKNKESFYNTKYRDEMKETLCRENGVKLIVVPYTVKLQDIKTYIQEKMGSF
jgi:hypothetical protein